MAYARVVVGVAFLCVLAITIAIVAVRPSAVESVARRLRGVDNVEEDVAQLWTSPTNKQYSIKKKWFVEPMAVYQGDSGGSVFNAHPSKIVGVLSGGDSWSRRPVMSGAVIAGAMAIAGTPMGIGAPGLAVGAGMGFAAGTVTYSRMIGSKEEKIRVGAVGKTGNRELGTLAYTLSLDTDLPTDLPDFGVAVQELEEALLAYSEAENAPIPLDGPTCGTTTPPGETLPPIVA